MGAVWSVLMSPKQTFERIRENGGAFVIPFIILIAVTLLTVYLQIPILEQSAEQLEQAQGLDVGSMKTITVVTGFIMTPVTVAAVVFIQALLLLLVNLIVRGEAKYMQLVKVSVLSAVPGLLSMILIGILGRTMEVDAAAQIRLSLAALLENKSGIVYSLANMIDPFALWGLAIMVIGTAVMAKKPASSVAVWIVGGWIAFSLLFAWIGSLFSM